MIMFSSSFQIFKDYNQGRINHGAKRAMAQGPPP